jgi:hypothetical protein
MTKRLLPLALLLTFLLGMAFIQFATPNMPDNDGFYHIKMAWLMRTQGLKPNFIWLPLTILNPREFYDHHFLFHVLLIPFTFGDLHVGAKLAAVVFSSLAFVAIWYLFQRQQIPYAWLWGLALLGISDAFLYRMSITRAQSLSLAVLALAYLWLLEGQYKQLAVLSFFYVWMYDAFPLILALAVLYFISAGLIEHRWDVKPLLFIFGGVGLGILINPYFPANIIFSYRHMLPKLSDATAVGVGNEWYPYTTQQLLSNSLPSLIAFASGIFALGLSARKMDPRTAFGFFLTLFFGWMLFEARRFVEYFPAFALIFAAFAWTPLLQPEVASEAAASSSRSRFRFAPILLSVAVIASAAISVPRARDAIRTSRPYTLYENASAWLVKNTPAGSRVFQTDWDDFPRLFFYNTHNTYLIGLDPTFMHLYDPKLYDLWVRITQGKVQQPSQVILNTFGSRYVHVDLQHQGFLKMAAQDPNLKEVYRDDQAVLFQVVNP